MNKTEKEFAITVGIALIFLSLGLPFRSRKYGIKIRPPKENETLPPENLEPKENQQI